MDMMLVRRDGKQGNKTETIDLNQGQVGCHWLCAYQDLDLVPDFRLGFMTRNPPSKTLLLDVKMSYHRLESPRFALHMQSLDPSIVHANHTRHPTCQLITA